MGSNDIDLGAYGSGLFFRHPGVSAQTAEKVETQNSGRILRLYRG